MLAYPETSFCSSFIEINLIEKWNFADLSKHFSIGITSFFSKNLLNKGTINADTSCITVQIFCKVKLSLSSERRPFLCDNVY